MSPTEEDSYVDELLVRAEFSAELQCVDFDSAIPNECHANADTYGAKFGGQAVRGWLVNRANEDTIWFTPHSVVRHGDGTLLEVTLSERDKNGHTFVEHFGSPEQWRVLEEKHRGGSSPQVIRALSGAFP